MRVILPWACRFWLPVYTVDTRPAVALCRVSALGGQVVRAPVAVDMQIIYHPPDLVIVIPVEQWGPLGSATLRSSAVCRRGS